MAKIVFNDGTNYTVKQDSLIVIEENSANDQQQTNVAVAVTTGTVDLTTATYVQGSKSQVIVAGAKASLAPDSSAMVHNDPKADQHEILVKKGSTDIERNGEVVRLSNWEKVSFQSRVENHGAGQGNRAAHADYAGQHDAGFHHSGEKSKEVEFSWTPMANAAGYRLRISHNPYFSSLLLDQKVEAANVVVTGLARRRLLLVDPCRTTRRAKNRWKAKRIALPSLPRPRKKWNCRWNSILCPTRTCDRGDGQDRSGSARDGQRQGSADRRRRWYVPLFHAALPNGENLITVTAQNSKGGVNTHQEKVVIQ